MIKHASWPLLTELPKNTITPTEYNYEQLERNDIDLLCALIKSWYPDISVGSGKKYIDPRFYEAKVYFSGEETKDVIVYIGRHGEEIVCALCLEVDRDALTLHSRYGVCAPAQRGTGATLFAAYIVDALAQAMGIAMAFSYVTMKSKAMQQFTERAGFEPVGILRFSDVELDENGEVRHVTEAIYAKYFKEAITLQSVSETNMTLKLKRLWDVLYA
ncbi:hypothetical protein C4J89_2681 [Pseudomonas sp. R4-35-07]|uniref:hypothetical protein n=1 Tax=Pseudomonas sp. R4-35-07 TaxID=658643 RepID=UPI000F55D30B|nr:hypothetical protein [Pseudomonas sp. R4-35-07]AZF32156.1 hypothetical protein C4J89_2681 [Pseudomonas sp. R4-35-07]